METRRDIPPKRPRESRCGKRASSSSAWFRSEERQGGRAASPCDWRADGTRPKRGRGTLRRRGWRELGGWRTTEEGGTRSGADVLRVAAWKSARERVCVCGESARGCRCVREAARDQSYERCTCTRHTGSRGVRPELGAVELWSTRSREVATPFLFSFIWVMCK